MRDREKEGGIRVEGRWFKGLRLRVEGIEIEGVSE